MSAPQFTPGPWVVRECQGDRYIIPAAHSERPLGGSIHEKQNRDHYALRIAAPGSSLQGFATAQERAANANLIAAAPELYQALVQSLPVIDDETRLGQQIRAALAKARGQ